MDIDYKLIGQRIKEARQCKQYSQSKLSEELDVSEAYLSRVERGHQINLNRLAQISNILGVKLEYFITGVVPKSKDYLDKDLYEVLINCSPDKQRLIYNIAKMVEKSKFI